MPVNRLGEFRVGGDIGEFERAPAAAAASPGYVCNLLISAMVASMASLVIDTVALAQSAPLNIQQVKISGLLLNSLNDPLQPTLFGAEIGRAHV